MLIRLSARTGQVAYRLDDARLIVHDDGLSYLACTLRGVRGGAQAGSLMLTMDEVDWLAGAKRTLRKGSGRGSPATKSVRRGDEG
jgi:hypothetical protein